MAALFAHMTQELHADYVFKWDASFLFEPSFGVVDLSQNTVRALGSWETAVTVTSPDDIGRLTAAILFAEPPLVN